MRIYDPADRIVYVHLSPGPAAPPASPQVPEACHRLPAGYANTALRARLTASDRPALVVLPGGATGVGVPAPAAPALRLAR